MSGFRDHQKKFKSQKKKKEKKKNDINVDFKRLEKIHCKCILAFE